MKGTRENQLEKAFAKWKDHLFNGMKERLEVCYFLFLFIRHLDRQFSDPAKERSRGRAEA